MGNLAVTVGTRIAGRLARRRLRPERRPGQRFRDVVVMFRPDPLSPECAGCWSRSAPAPDLRPDGRVTSIEASAVVLATGSVNLRRFRQRPGEALVLGLLDRTATIRDRRPGHRDRRGDGPDPHQGLGADELAVRDFGSAGPPPRQVRQVEWEELEVGPIRGGAGRRRAARRAVPSAADITSMLQDLDPKRRHEIAAAGRRAAGRRARGARTPR
jgi:hypothetical protein